MGSQVIAVCRCGINSTIAVGGGMASHETEEFFPGFCLNCKEVMEMNLKEEFPLCTSCIKEITIPYNDPRLIGIVGKEEISRSFDNVLTDGTYLCPSCRQFTLRFAPGHVLWD